MLNATICAVTVVPTLAPKITPTDCTRVMSPGADETHHEYRGHRGRLDHCGHDGAGDGAQNCVAGQLGQQRIHLLVDEQHHPVFVISVRDIVEFLVEAFPREVLTLSSDASAQVPRGRYGA